MTGDCLKTAAHDAIATEPTIEACLATSHECRSAQTPTGRADCLTMTTSTAITGRPGHSTSLAVALLALLIFVLGGCTSDGSEADTAASPQSDPTTVSEAPSDVGTAYDIDGLGLQFDLPASFASAEDETLLFLARSVRPPAIFSINPASPGEILHDAETGETVTPLTFGDVHAIVVLNAVVEGLPPGIAANELVVANGARSFSLILSAPPTDLADLWEPFVESISVEPA